MGRVSCAPHHPDGSTCERACEGKHLDAGVASERGRWNDAVLDGIGGTSSYSNGAGDLKDCGQDHCPSVGDGSRGDGCSPCV